MSRTSQNRTAENLSTSKSSDERIRKKNHERLISLLSNLPSCESPEGWEAVGKFAVGGLTEIGFSKTAELLLVVSSSGRGVIDCAQGEKNRTMMKSMETGISLRSSCARVSDHFKMKQSILLG